MAGTPDPRLRYRPGDEPKNIGLQQEPADTHLTTDGEQA